MVLQVSLVGAVTLLVAVLTLLLPRHMGNKALTASSYHLTSFYLAWLGLSYSATALQEILNPPEVLQSIGLWGYSTKPPAVAPFLLHLLTTLAVAGLARSCTLGSSSNRAAGRGAIQGAEAVAGSFGTGLVQEQQQQQGHDSSPLAAPSTSSDEATAAATVVNALAQEEQQLLQLWSQHLQSWGDTFGLGAIQGLWHVGQLLVPLSWGVLAASRPDILHGIYLLAMVTWMLAINCSTIPQLARPPLWVEAVFVQQEDELRSGVCRQQQQQQSELHQEQHQPSQQEQQQQQQPLQEVQMVFSSSSSSGIGKSSNGAAAAVVSNALPAAANPRYSLFRIYATAHLLVIYIALVLQLPGLKSDFNQRVLQLVGLLDPRMITDLVPVLLVLLMATVHEALGKWLLSKEVEGVAADADARKPPVVAAGVAVHGPVAEQEQEYEPPATALAAATAAVGEGRSAARGGRSAAGDGIGSSDAASGVAAPRLLLWWLVAVQPRLLSQALLSLGRSALFGGVSLYVLVVSGVPWKVLSPCPISRLAIPACCTESMSMPRLAPCSELAYVPEELS